MVTREDYATLSASAYNADRNQYNQLDFTPAGWTQIGAFSDPVSGFGTQAYQNGTEVVISFEGTNAYSDYGQLLDPTTWDRVWSTASDWLYGDLPLTLGSVLSILGGGQIFQAAAFYAQIKAANPGVNISFTGHSLGGGIASVMSVWFDRPATTFAEMPFGNTASSTSAMATVALGFLQSGYVDNKLLALLPDAVRYPLLDKFGVSGGVIGTDTYANRVNNVTHYYVDGEVAADLRQIFPAIIGNNNVLANNHTNVGSTDLHSIVLHAAFLIQPTLRFATYALPSLLAEVFDTNLYAQPLEG